MFILQFMLNNTTIYIYILHVCTIWMLFAMIEEPENNITEHTT